jgi:hypothetical protein
LPVLEPRQDLTSSAHRVANTGWVAALRPTAERNIPRAARKSPSRIGRAGP